jgi:K+-transporting ATPase KdpF subunit
LARRDSSRSGPSRRPAIEPRSPAMFDYLVSGVVAALLLVYLGWAMFQPEKF